jgi:hypothetical protein
MRVQNKSSAPRSLVRYVGVTKCSLLEGRGETTLVAIANGTAGWGSTALLAARSAYLFRLSTEKACRERAREDQWPFWLDTRA